MSKLYRPHVPLSVCCEVAERQLRAAGEIKDVIAVAGSRTYSNKLRTLLPWLAWVLGCEPSELRLDHDPPLAARPRNSQGLGLKSRYEPDANDPDHLFYRPHGAQHAGSHDVKTRIRGDHGQLSDLALIKKARRYDPLTKNKPPKRKVKIHSKGFDKVSRPFQKRTKK
jgi:hypothetical protein